MKKYIIILLTFWAAFSFAQKTDAIFKNIKKEHILHTDGNIEYKYYKEVKLLSPYAFNRLYGETFIVYNPDFQKLKIHKAFTIMKDGRKVEAPQNAFNKVLPRNASNYPAYNQMIEMVVTHTGLEVGATIYMEYSIFSNPKFINEMMGTEIVGEAVPIDMCELVLKVPARRGLRYELLNSKIVPEETNDGKYRSISWKFEDLAENTKEHAIPDLYDLRPTLLFSTFMNDTEMFKQFSMQQAFLEKSLPISLIENLKEIKANKNNDPLAKAQAVQKMIVNDINTKHIPLDWHNYQLETPRRVWDANVGSELEKTILFYKALQFVGLDVKVVGMYPLSLLGNAPIVLSYFKDYGVMVSPNEKGSEPFILSAHQMNQNTLELSHPTDMVIDMHNGDDLFYKSIKNHINVQANLTLDLGNEISGDVKLKLQGGFLQEFKLQSNASDVIKELNPPLPMKEKTDLKVKMSKHHISIGYETFSKGKTKQQENYNFWQLPQIKSGIAAQYFNTLPVLRDLPIVVNSIEESYEYELTLPKSIEWVGKDIHKSYEESFGKMTIDITLKDGKLIVMKNLSILPGKTQLKAKKSAMNVESKEIEVQQRILSVEEYDIFRQMMIDWNSDLVNMLVFKR